MGLRARVSVIVFGFVAVIVGGLALAGLLREDLLREQLARASVAGSQALWGKIVETGVQRLREQALAVTENSDLRAVLADGDRGRISLVASALYQTLAKTRDVSRLDLATPDGEVIYSSFPSFEPDSSVSSATISRMAGEERGEGGIGNDASRNVTLSFGAPVFGLDGTVSAVAVVASDIGHALEELRKGTGSEVLIVNRRGRLLAGTQPELWEELRGEAALVDNATQVIGAESHVYSTTTLPIVADLGTLVAFLVTVQDATEAYAEQRRVALISLGVVFLFLAFALLVLSLYLHRALSPLLAGVEVLDSLARGDTHVATLEGGSEGDDEVSQLARAVNAFRDQSVALRRHRRSRERRRWLQERFIRAEMTRLAGTLEETARRDVLSDLVEIERRSEDLAVEPRGSESAPPGDEGLQLMGLAFEKMTDRVQAQQRRLSDLVAELQEALRTRTAYLALQHDLEIARRVQHSFLPESSFDAGDVRIRSYMGAAKDVGGDFYDFFELDENRIGIVIADVAGKGVPAALFMAVARTLIRATAQQGMEGPGACLELVNNLLVDTSREEVFVTVFYGEYDRRTGVLNYANGGHNPPIIVSAEGTEALPLTGGLVLAMFSGLKYREAAAKVPSGGKLVLFTDGVSEAQDLDGAEFGEERIHASLERTRTRGPADTIEATLREVEAFAGEAEQADDITMVVLSRGAQPDRSIVRRFALRNELEQIAALQRGIEEFSEAAGIGPADEARLQVVMEELVINVINHGIPEGERSLIRIRLLFEDGVAEMTVEDEGVPFNPLTDAVEAQTNLPLEERSIGGLGVKLMLEMMDQTTYQRVGGRNRLLMRKRVNS